MKWSSLNRTVAPPATPVSLTEAKAHLRVSDSDSDDLILGHIEAAAGFCERHTNRAFVEQTWAMKLDDFPRAYGDRGRYIELPKPPTLSITSITYVDADGATQTLASNQYVFHADEWQPFIAEAFGVTWPNTRCQPGAVTVTFVAGYAQASGSYTPNIPPGIKSAVLQYTQGKFDNLRPDDQKALEDSIKLTLNQHRVPVI